MRFWRSHLLIACAASTATALVVGGIAWATIPNNMDGSITACYRTTQPNKGSVRIIDHQGGRDCRKGEAILIWPSHIFRWRGEWQSSFPYKINDVVSMGGSSYIALRPTTNVLPVSAGYWALMASAGSTGPSGATGATGPSGVAQCGGYPHDGIDWSIASSTPGTGCNLTGAFLANQVLTNANLTNANFTNANLTGVNLSSSNLTGANLTGAIGLGAATVTGVVWSATTCPDASISNTNGTSPESCIGH